MELAVAVRQVSLAAFGVGVLLVIYGAWQWWDGAQAFARMRPTTCKVMSRVIDEKMLISSRRSSFKPPTARIRQEAHLEFAHTVDGRPHRFSEDFVYDWAQFAKTGYEQGKDYPCRYDPLNPSRGTIRSEFDWTAAGDNLALGAAVMLLAVVASSFKR